MILALRTDSPVAEIYLLGQTGKQLHKYSWQADRKLARDLLSVLTQQLKKAKVDFAALTGLVVYQGPGSFTGLRIGITVANTIAYAQNIPIVGAQGDDWLQTGVLRITKNQSDRIVLPHYGLEPNISTQKH